ncbi:MAG: NADPH-dependent reductase [Sphaerisporangium sp.]|nr:NADPH-dependent reductase [Sphaerisporangium sp.]
MGVLHFLSSPHLHDALLGTFENDVLVVGDDREATDLVEALSDEIPGLTSVYAGGLRAAEAVEGLVAALRQVEQDRSRLVGMRLGGQGNLRLLD